MTDAVNAKKIMSTLEDSAHAAAEHLRVMLDPKDRLERFRSTIRNAAFPDSPAPNRGFGDASELSKPIWRFLKEAHDRAVPRKDLPHKLRRFPLAKVTPVKKAILWALAQINFDQRMGQLAMVDAFKALVSDANAKLNALADAVDQQHAADQHAMLALATTRDSVSSLRRSIEELTGRIDSLAESQREIKNAIEQSTQTRLDEMNRQLVTVQSLASFRTREAVSVEVPSKRKDDNNPRLPDRFIMDLGEKFRGEYSDVQERQRQYLADVVPVARMFTDKVCLDLGMGRGEWLELLTKAGVPALGIDDNEILVEAAASRRLNVLCVDILEYLRGCPDGSVAVISAFHIIEHFAAGVLLTLLGECRRVLCPGGLLLLETPDPENINVGACNFYLDPTHHHPLPPLLGKFILDYLNFEDVSIRRVNPGDSHAYDDQRTSLDEYVINAFLGPMDYALFARKPHA
jgi:SAM-dependent methyltransferase